MLRRKGDCNEQHRWSPWTRFLKNYKTFLSSCGFKKMMPEDAPVMLYDGNCICEITNDKKKPQQTAISWGHRTQHEMLSILKQIPDTVWTIQGNYDKMDWVNKMYFLILLWRVIIKVPMQQDLISILQINDPFIQSAKLKDGSLLREESGGGAGGKFSVTVICSLIVKLKQLHPAARTIYSLALTKRRDGTGSQRPKYSQSLWSFFKL